MWKRGIDVVNVVRKECQNICDSILGIIGEYVDEPTRVIGRMSPNTNPIFYIAGHRIKKCMNGTIRPVLSWGEYGIFDGQFIQPCDLSVSNGKVCVCDSGQHRIQIFDMNGRFLHGIGICGKGPGEFISPSKCVANDNYLYVMEEKGYRVQVFDLKTYQYLFEIKAIDYFYDFAVNNTHIYILGEEKGKQYKQYIEIFDTVCNNVMRSSHNVMRSSHNVMRSSHNVMRSSHNVMRSSHNVMRSSHFKKRIPLQSWITKITATKIGLLLQTWGNEITWLTYHGEVKQFPIKSAEHICVDEQDRVICNGIILE
jgi:hypothetical protein